MNQVNSSNNRSNAPAGKKPNGQRNNRRRYRNFNKNRPTNPVNQLERLVEKYINLLDQHLVARRKFHDLYYRADDPQLNKLEKNFYSTLNEMRDFEEKIAPELKESFEKRINGLKPDQTYSINHNIDLDYKPVEVEISKIDDPHLLQSQIKANYSEDAEESMGTLEDYNKYKMI